MMGVLVLDLRGYLAWLLGRIGGGQGMAPEDLSVWVEFPLEVDLNRPRYLLGTNLGCKLGW